MTSEARSSNGQWLPTRRSVLRGGVLIGLGAVLTACSGGNVAGPTATVTGPPKKGGNLRVGFVGGGAADTLDGAIATNLGDIARAINMYNTLMYRDDNYELQPMLATSITPNSDATVWTAKLRKDVKFCDGRPMTADDVVASIERIIDPEDPKSGAAGLAPLEKVIALDDHTVEFQLNTPDSSMDDVLGQYSNTIVPADFDPEHPVGTGPYMLESFTAAQSTILRANPYYWGDEGPYLDTIELLNFNDTDALINALLSTQVDVVAQIPAALSEVIAADERMQVLDSETGMWLPFTMRTDVEPFDDERVRQAFRLAADREQMINQVLSGHGRVGNDMYAPFDPAYPDFPQRKQDIQEAKRLLAEAGYPDGLEVELVTAPIQAGVVEAAQVYAEQAAQAGIKVKINRMDLTAYWGDYLEYPFSQSFWYTRNFLPQANSGSMPDAPFNETHWDDKEFVSIVEKARAETDESKRNKLIEEAQRIMYDRGSLIIWGFANQLDAYQSYVGGLVPNTTGLPLSGFQLHRVWIGDLS